MFTDRFEIQKKDYSYSAQVNFAECREKVKIDPNATVCVDFMKEEQEKKAVKAAESPHPVFESLRLCNRHLQRTPYCGSCVPLHIG